MKYFFLSLSVMLVLVGGIIWLVLDSQSTDGDVQTNNVMIVDGRQIIDITAHGGYSPVRTIAQADMPTTIRLTSQGTFDCSSAVIIPSLGYRKNLPPSGTTDVPVPAQSAGTTLRGLCAMGMYNFAITFE